jgi:hypothetical protein
MYKKIARVFKGGPSLLSRLKVEDLDDCGHSSCSKATMKLKTGGETAEQQGTPFCI